MIKELTVNDVEKLAKFKTEEDKNSDFERNYSFFMEIMTKSNNFGVCYLENGLIKGCGDFLLKNGNAYVQFLHCDTKQSDVMQMTVLVKMLNKLEEKAKELNAKTFYIMAKNLQDKLRRLGYEEILETKTKNVFMKEL